MKMHTANVTADWAVAMALMSPAYKRRNDQWVKTKSVFQAQVFISVHTWGTTKDTTVSS